MTFEDWMVSVYQGQHAFKNPEQAFRSAWDAGAAAEQAKCKGFASMLAQATVLAEREKCAQLVETYEKSATTMGALEFVMVFKDCAAAIRARGQQ